MAIGRNKKKELFGKSCFPIGKHEQSLHMISFADNCKFVEITPAKRSAQIAPFRKSRKLYNSLLATI